MDIDRIFKEGFSKEYGMVWNSLETLAGIYGNPATEAVVKGLRSGENREFYAREYRRTLQEATPYIENIENFFSRLGDWPMGEFIDGEKMDSLNRAKEDLDKILGIMIEAFEKSRPQFH